MRFQAKMEQIFDTDYSNVGNMIGKSLSVSRLEGLTRGAIENSIPTPGSSTYGPAKTGPVITGPAKSGPGVLSGSKGADDEGGEYKRDDIRGASKTTTNKDQMDDISLDSSHHNRDKDYEYVNPMITEAVDDNVI